MGYLGFEGRGRTYRVCHAHFKNAILLSISLVGGYIYSGADIITYPNKEILSKIAFFKRAWQTLKVLPRPCLSSS